MLHFRIDSASSQANPPAMISHKAGGLALILASVIMLVAMTHHPAGHDLMSPSHFAAIGRLNTVVHSIALFIVPLLFLGGWALTLSFDAPNFSAAAALTLFGFSLVAVVNAGTLNGLVALPLFRHVLDSQGWPDATLWRAILEYNGRLNQAFTTLFVVGSALAILLWSIAMLKERATRRLIAIYGCIAGPLIALDMLSGRLQLDVQGFGAVVVAESIWFIVAGAQLYRLSPQR